MKDIQTNKTESFETWRINNINKYGIFIWLQLNYIKNEDAKIIQTIIELKKNLNPLNSAENLKRYLDKRGVDCFILDFVKSDSEYYVKNIERLHKLLNLNLKQSINNEIFKDKTYWSYRLITKPQNCLTADIDSLENFNNTLVSIEAAQLFNTENIEESIKHIFRTFKFRANEVNPEQYLSQYNFSKIVNGDAYILFHKIDKNNNNALDDKSECLLIENSIDFYNMLKNINSLKRDDEDIFIEIYGEYLNDNLSQFKNIYSLYDHLSDITGL